MNKQQQQQQKKTAENVSSSVGCNLCFKLGPKEPGWDFYLNNTENENTIIIINTVSAGTSTEILIVPSKVL